MRIDHKAAWLSGAAVLLYGAVAAWANRGHGGEAALRAALVQGLSSGLTTYTIAAVVRRSLARPAPAQGWPRLPRWARAALPAFAASASLHMLLNLWAGTPELAATVALPIAAAAIFSVVYATAAERRSPIP